MGFRGLTITDDLEMGAIATEWSVAEGALKSFKAGADILLICKDQSHVRESLDLLRQALFEGMISPKRLARSLERIRKMKKEFLGHRDEISLAGVREYFKRSA
jgi:beta-N-acetylhexosaminidase